MEVKYGSMEVKLVENMSGVMSDLTIMLSLTALRHLVHC